MDELIAFITARLDEDERYAGAAGGGKWTYDSARQLLAGLGQVIVKVANFGVTAFGWHIARHDPARVLREVERKRGLLADIAVAAEYSPSLAHSMLSEMAGMWSDHQDYRQEWKP